LQVLQSENETRLYAKSSEQAWIREIVRYSGRGRDVVIKSDPSRNHSADLLSVAVACVQSDQSDVQSLLILPEPDSVRDIASLSGKLPGGNKPANLRIVHLGPAEDARSEARAVSTGPDLVVTTPQRLIDHIRRNNIDLSRVAVCVLDPPAGKLIGQFSADLHYIYTKFDRQPTTIMFTRTDGEEMTGIEDVIRRPATVSLPEAEPMTTDPGGEPRQEQTKMANSELPFDPESTAQQLRDLVRRIHEAEDPDVMNHYKRFIKKHVPVFTRAYFTAYLFKQWAGGSASSSTKASIFISAGRNRRLHARDLVTLFTSAEGVTRDDVGQVKVLDNYSFVEIEASKAKQAIDGLNGTDFRGRKLTVNYARRK